MGNLHQLVYCNYPHYIFMHNILPDSNTGVCGVQFKSLTDPSGIHSGIIYIINNILKFMWYVVLVLLWCVIHMCTPLHEQMCLCFYNYHSQKPIYSQIHGPIHDSIALNKQQLTYKQDLSKLAQRKSQNYTNCKFFSSATDFFGVSANIQKHCKGTVVTQVSIISIIFFILMF